MAPVSATFWMRSRLKFQEMHDFLPFLFTSFCQHVTSRQLNLISRSSARIRPNTYFGYSRTITTGTSTFLDKEVPWKGKSPGGENPGQPRYHWKMWCRQSVRHPKNLTSLETFGKVNRQILANAKPRSMRVFFNLHATSLIFLPLQQPV
jgi:hypothetical protein